MCIYTSSDEQCNPGFPAEFLGAVFAPADAVLIRHVETWTDAKKQSLPHRPVYTTAAEFSPEAFRELAALAEAQRANQFFGVCPRGGAAEGFDLAAQIRTARVLWADVDGATDAQAKHRCAAAGLPVPSIIVRSGNGVHLYWLLAEPYLIDDAEPPFPIYKRRVGGKKVLYAIGQDGAETEVQPPALTDKALRLQGVVGGVARAVGGDHTTDLARLLRLPNTWNRKDARNGKAPLPCVVAELNATRVYDLGDFKRHAEPVKPAGKSRCVAPGCDAARAGKTLSALTAGQVARLDELVEACRTTPVGERSEADFALLAHAVRCGLDPEVLWELCRHAGKFGDRRRDYFDLGWRRAVADVAEKDAALREEFAGDGPGAEPGNDSGCGVGEGGRPADGPDDAWPDPLPLDAQGGPVPEFPVEALRDICPAYYRLCRAVAQTVQVPVDLPALMGLSVLGVPLAGRVEIAIAKNSFVPAVVWTLSALPPGERKTPAVEPVWRPIVEWEARRREAAREQVAAQQAKRKRAERRKADIERAFGQDGGETLIREHAELGLELAAPQPALPQLLVDDATVESLGPILEQQEGRIGCLSDEATFLMVAMGRYSGNEGHFEMYLRGYDGGGYRVNRVGRASLFLPRIFLTLGLCIQTKPFLELANNPAADEKGFFARFFTAMPRSLMGRRTYRPDRDAAAAKEEWSKLLFGMLDGQRPRTLRHSAEGWRIVEDFHDRYEPLLGENRELASLRAVAGKMVPGGMLRIAAVLHCASGEAGDVVPPATLRAAVAVADYFLGHSRAIHNAREDRPSLELARKIRDHLARNRIEEFSYRQFKDHVYAVKKADKGVLDDAYEWLQARRIVRAVGRTTRGTPRFRANPKLWAQLGTAAPREERAPQAPAPVQKPAEGGWPAVQAQGHRVRTPFLPDDVVCTMHDHFPHAGLFRLACALEETRYRQLTADQQGRLRYASPGRYVLDVQGDQFEMADGAAGEGGRDMSA